MSHGLPELKWSSGKRGAWIATVAHGSYTLFPTGRRQTLELTYWPADPKAYVPKFPEHELDRAQELAQAHSDGVFAMRANVIRGDR